MKIHLIPIFPHPSLGSITVIELDPSPSFSSLYGIISVPASSLLSPPNGISSDFIPVLLLKKDIPETEVITDHRVSHFSTWHLRIPSRHDFKDSDNFCPHLRLTHKDILLGPCFICRISTQEMSFPIVAFSVVVVF